MDDARYSIVDDQSRDDYRRNGGIIPGREVTFREESTGSEGTVWIALTNYNADYVHSQIQPLANEIRRVRQLGQGG